MPRLHQITFVLGLLIALTEARSDEAPPRVWTGLGPERFSALVESFNAMEDEPVVNLVPNAEAWRWMETRVPRFECADPEVERVYWFRWWALRKHLRLDPATGRQVFSEFITRPRPVSSALGHHLMEGRWLKDQAPYDDYVLYWLRGKEGGRQDHLHRYSQWLTYALWQRWHVTRDTAGWLALLDDVVADYRAWETERGRADGLFWQHDVWDAMEESISGGRKVKHVRPTLSVYMYGNALALARLAEKAGRPELAKEFQSKADHLRSRVQAVLWDESQVFFGSVTETLERIPVREAIGFIPWYFGLPEPGRGYERAWAQAIDTAGFRASYGLTTAERRHPRFRSHGTGTCEWDGAVWPFATAQTLTAWGRVLRDYPTSVVTPADYFEAFLTYTRSHRYDGRLYLGEYQDETTGAWLKGPDPRSRWYNHSTYADLLIEGVVGLRPREDDILEVFPLLPAGTWPWFCLDGASYRGRNVSILWDKDGKKYGLGPGLQVWIDGRRVARSDRLERLLVPLP